MRTLYVKNSVIANRGSGIFHEEAYDCIIRGNYVAHNGVHGVFISSSSDVETHGNHITANRLAGVQLFVDGATGYDLANDLVHDNVFRMRDGTYNGLSAAGGADATVYSTLKNNRFQGNTYSVPNASDRFSYWNGNWKTWSQWRASGQDTVGKLLILP